MRKDELTTGESTPTRVATAGAARAHARAVVDACWPPSSRPAREEDLIDLLLVVSEMVTNAIRHGGGLAGFAATPVRDGIRVAVHDHSEEVPAVAFGSGALPASAASHRGNGHGGYGWPLIIRLAREIDVERRPGSGKTITAFVPIRTAAAPASDTDPANGRNGRN